MLNKLLQRQIQKHLPGEQLSEKFIDFLNIISASYDHYDQDRKMLERSIDISSEELYELHQSERNAHEELRTLFQNIGEVFFSEDIVNRKLIQISDACRDIFGYNPEEFINDNNLLTSVVFNEDREIIIKSYKDLASGQKSTQQYRIIHKDGTVKWVEIKINPTLDPDNNLIRIDGVITDINNRIKTEQEKYSLLNTLKESEEQFYSLFNNARDPMFLLDDKQIFINCNEAAVKILGARSKDQIIGKLPKDFSTEYQEDGQLSSEKSKKMDKDAFTKGNIQFEWLHQKFDGTPFPVDVSLSVIPMEKKNILLVHWRDITDKKIAEAKMHEANNNLKISIDRLNEAQQIAKVGNWNYDVRSGQVMFSKEYYKIFEREEEGLPLNIAGYFNIIHAEDRNMVEEKFKRFMIDHQPFQCECRMLSLDQSVKTIQANVKCTKDDNGNLVSFYGTIQDVSEQKLFQEKLEKNIIELKKRNSELDRFVYSVSHDLRAPLCSMMGILELAEDDTEDESVRGYYEMLRGGMHKLDGFISDILDYSRNSRVALRPEAINFRELVNDITDNLKYMGGSRLVRIEININNESPFVSDKSRIKSILNNLISNAIRYQNPDVENPFVHIDIEMNETESKIVVKDNGIGISQKNLDKIFEMFYRVSENSVGSGLGLYIVKESVSVLQGELKVESDLGSGTTFRLNLPNLIVQTPADVQQ